VLETERGATESCGALPHLICSADASDPSLHTKVSAIPFLHPLLVSFLSSVACNTGMPTSSSSYEVCYYCFLNILTIIVRIDKFLWYWYATIDSLYLWSYMFTVCTFAHFFSPYIWTT
jgi:hypothetical protein